MRTDKREPATPGGEVADEVRRWLGCVRVDVLTPAFILDNINAAVDRLAHALAASEEARAKALREYEIAAAAWEVRDKDADRLAAELAALAGSVVEAAEPVGGYAPGATLVDRVVALRADRDRLRAELAEARERLAEAVATMRDYVERENVTHETDCPQDDTCNCNAAPLIARINAVCALATRGSTP